MDACVSIVMSLFLLSLIKQGNGALDTWRPQSQTLHSRMVSIEEKLQNMDNTKCDATLREIMQKLEDLQTTVRRQDSTVQDKLDKLERNLNSKEIKDELMVEKLSHMRDILDTSYDRYSRRLGYTEERLEMSLKKVQMSVEGILTRLEKNQEDIQADLTETLTVMEDLKASTATDERLNSTQKAIKQHIQNVMTPSRDELQRITGSLDHIGSRLNSSLGMWGSQNDVPQSNDILSTIRTEINLESNKLTSKVNNMYNEMWRRMTSMESLLKELGRLENTTRQDLLEEMRSLVPSDHHDFPGESQENFLEVALDALERKLQKLGRNIDDRMDTITARQDLVLDSCFEGGMCQGLESRLSQVLERIFDIFSVKIENSTNRTFNLSSLVMELMELEKMHHSILIRTVTHNTNMVVTLAKDNNDANKLLYHNITLLADHIQEVHEEIDNLNGKVCNENETKTECEPAQVTSEHAAEVNFFPLNGTEGTPDVTKKHYDVGVLKITTDNFAIMAEKVYKSPENTSQAVDGSIMHIISTLSPNLTSQQKDSLIRVLNSSVSFDNLEAIIQNTEADAGSIEVYDTELLNRTNSEDELNEENPEAAVPGENNNFEETDELLNQDSTTEKNDDSTITSNITEFTETGTNGAITNKTQPNLLKLPVELRDHVRMYKFLWELKNGLINVTETIEQIKTKNNDSDSELLFVLQNLCFGQEVQGSFSYDSVVNAMEKRLFIINQISNSSDLYENIENICNNLTETLPLQTTTEGEIL